MSNEADLLISYLSELVAFKILDGKAVKPIVAGRRAIQTA
jgi:hypothetical protein